MHFFERSYLGNADQAQMSALAWEIFDHSFRVIDLPYRFSSWGLDDPRNARLWFFEDGRMAGWAALQAPFWQVDIACRPDVEQELFQQILTWIDQRARELTGTPHFHEAWYVMVFSTQKERITDLERQGYICQADLGEDAWSKVIMERDASHLERMYPPPPGFTVRPLRGADEVEAYVDLHRAVFNTRNMTVEWRRRTLLQPEYHPELDIIVEAPDGRSGAFCVGWLRNGVGQIEPLGCHPDFRSKALGRVALVEVLRRLLAAGAQKILVETDEYRTTAFLLYESLGFRVIRNVLVYGKEYPPLDVPAANQAG